MAANYTDSPTNACTSSATFGAVVRFSCPSLVITTLSSIRTPPTDQYSSSTLWSMYLAFAGSLRNGSMMNRQK